MGSATMTPHGIVSVPVPAGTRTGDVFLLEGEYWTIAYSGLVCRLRDSKGLRYLAHLLSRPGEYVHCGALGSTVVDGKETACNAERARLAVTKRIKAAVEKIQEHHPALGQHLVASIKTGSRCAYLPGPHDSISWSV